MKIAILVPYFGRWPEFFPSFLWSLGFNPQLHYHFITDLPAPDNVPENCIFHYQTLEGIQSLIHMKLGINLHNFFPYKLCDIRPAYAYLFEEIINDYDWWGYGDVDLVLGNVGKFIEDIESYDVISFREFWPSGSLSIYRNIDFFKRMYLSIPNWKQLMSEPEFLGLDEVSRQFSDIRQQTWEKIDWKYGNLTVVINQLESEGKIKVRYHKYIKEYLHPQDWIRVDESGCFDQNGNEFAYYHFISEKKRYFSDFTLPAHPQVNYFGHSGAITEKQLQRLGAVHAFRKVKFFERYLKHWHKKINNKLGI